MTRQTSYPPLQVGPRTVPSPVYASEAARQHITKSSVFGLSGGNYPANDDKAAWRAHIDSENASMRRLYTDVIERCEVSVERVELGGGRAAIVTPDKADPKLAGHVVMNIHGGAFVYGEGQGAVFDAAVFAKLGRIKTVAVDYRVPPDHPFPANLEDTVAVYKALVSDYGAKNIAICGTSAGATYTATTILKLRDLGLPLPAAAGLFSPASDLGRVGDSAFANEGLDQIMSGARPMNDKNNPMTLFVGDHDPNDPLISPVNADFSKGFVPTYFLTGTRDMLLSSTVVLHRKMHNAGVETELHVFEAMSHAFNYFLDLPEAEEATRDMVGFFKRHFGNE